LNFNVTLIIDLQQTSSNLGGTQKITDIKTPKTNLNIMNIPLSGNNKA